MYWKKERKSHWKEYWSTDPWLETPVFPKTMARRKFEQIMTFLHFNGNSETPLPADRFQKLNLSWIIFYQNFNWSIYPNELSLDEAMIKWRGRLRLKIYNPRKLTKYGILVSMVSKSETGYLCNLEIYTDEGKKLQETILLVLQPYLGSWHHIYQDDYYNTMSTSEILLENKTRVCGTLREIVVYQTNWRRKLKIYRGEKWHSYGREKWFFLYGKTRG